MKRLILNLYAILNATKHNATHTTRTHTHAHQVTPPPSGAESLKQLPPNYNGWMQYAATNYTPSYDVMTNAMSVPDLPKAVPDILYFFPGLQNIDWIPKVDPEPTSSNPFDIIQVLTRC